ncbi:MAG: hypothetical protein BAJALOKI3v1_50067 [Promethearchaeota archaeon]|nr:MAG: hypothetical protein BAJALOKI3v1_50067 [Candidatus Lokiarchaeota archaeon]
MNGFFLALGIALGLAGMWVFKRYHGSKVFTRNASSRQSIESDCHYWVRLERKWHRFTKNRMGEGREAAKNNSNDAPNIFAIK